jgi:hypothetical protein
MDAPRHHPMPLSTEPALLHRTCISFTLEQRDRLEKVMAASGQATMASIIRTLVDRHLDEAFPVS